MRSTAPVHRRMMDSFLPLLVLVSSSAFHGCGDAAPEKKPQAPTSTVIATTEGGYRIRMAPAPERLPLNEHASFEIEVMPAADGAKLDGIEVTIDADMPAHKHGINTVPVVTRLAEGRYRVDGMLLHMPGDWVINVDVSRDGKAERAVFAFALDAGS